ncbi:PolyA nuclease [Pyrenophora tritici-repentis]|nr:PolyA nuclease [Pyrenophora tritici-repentis]
MTSAQMADSFRGNSASSVPPPVPAKTTKIPNIRLSFITAQDQAKFEQLFKTAVGTSHALSGDQARDLLMRSKLSGDDLSHIWTLSDTTKSGQLLFPEFALAMYLCNIKLTGKDLPNSLPERVKNEVSSMVDIISFGISEESSKRPTPSSNAPKFNEVPTIQQPQPQATNSQLLTTLVSQPTGFGQQPMGMQPQPTGFGQHRQNAAPAYWLRSVPRRLQWTTSADASNAHWVRLKPGAQPDGHWTAKHRSSGAKDDASNWP